MPMYEYKCTKCGHKFDELVYKPEDEPHECPACHTAHPVKLISEHCRMQMNWSDGPLVPKAV